MNIFFQLFSNDPNIVRVEPGKPLFREGEVGHLMYVLTSGRAEVIVNNRVVETLLPGNVVGELGIVSPEPRSASVFAIEACEFVAVDEKRFQYLVQQVPFFATQVMRVMAERLRKANQMIQPVEEI